VEEQVRDVGAHQLQIQVTVVTGEGGHDGGGAAPILGHPAAARVFAVATVVIALVFVAYAWSGADLCLWCAVLGR